MPREIAEDLRIAPGDKLAAFFSRPMSSSRRTSAPRVRISVPRREEFKEAIGGAFADGADQGGGAVGKDRDKLIYPLTAFSYIISYAPKPARS